MSQNGFCVGPPIAKSHRWGSRVSESLTDGDHCGFPQVRTRQMEPNSNQTRNLGVIEIALAHSAQCGLLFDLARSCMVSRKWRVGGGEAFRMLVHLDFRVHEARVTRRTVRCALVRIAGPSLRSVDLAEYRGRGNSGLLNRKVPEGEEAGRDWVHVRSSHTYICCPCTGCPQRSLPAESA